MRRRLAKLERSHDELIADYMRMFHSVRASRVEAEWLGRVVDTLTEEVTRHREVLQRLLAANAELTRRLQKEDGWEAV